MLKLTAVLLVISYANNVVFNATFDPDKEAGVDVEIQEAKVDKPKTNERIALFQKRKDVVSEN